VKHKSFINYTHSLGHISTLDKNDIMVQLATSTFDAHVLEILAPLILGATIVMMHPNGNLEFAYFYQTLQDKQVTHLQAVPTFLNHLLDFIKKELFHPWVSMRNVCCVGK
jgi:acyl-coenzyme A synthetase/AMP-(fatty) acid ligase